jgi:hypothetical protein
MNLNGFPPNVWGPGLWTALHLITLTIPPRPSKQRINAYYHLFHSLRETLPCGSCRTSFKIIMDAGPLKLHRSIFQSRGKAFRWLVRVHNAVNAKLGKPQTKKNPRIWEKHYERLRAPAQIK